MNIVLKIVAFAGTALLGAVCGGVAVSKMNKTNNTPAEQPSPDNTATSAENTSTSSEATE
jgi:hypothetical protein